MHLDKLSIVLPCDQIEDLALNPDAEEAAQMLAAWSAPWHPALLAAAGVPKEPLSIVVTPTALGYSLLGVGLAVLALLIPALAASRHTIVTFKWERARALLRPLWQRYFLDFLLLVPPLYGWYLLRQQGTSLSAEYSFYHNFSGSFQKDVRIYKFLFKQPFSDRPDF